MTLARDAFTRSETVLSVMPRNPDNLSSVVLFVVLLRYVLFVLVVGDGGGSCHYFSCLFFFFRWDRVSLCKSSYLNVLQGCVCLFVCLLTCLICLLFVYC